MSDLSYCRLAMPRSDHPFGPAGREIMNRYHVSYSSYLDGQCLQFMVENYNPVIASVRQIILKMDLAANGADGPPLLPFRLTRF